MTAKSQVSRIAADGRSVVIDIYQTDEFFGESALLKIPTRPEQASALEPTKVMVWNTAEIEEIIRKRRKAFAERDPAD